MDMLNVLLVVVLVQGVVCQTDPAACSRDIKKKILEACGQASRSLYSRALPYYPDYTKEEVDRLYDDMVERNMIPGVRKGSYPQPGVDYTISGAYPLYYLYFWKKRPLMDVHKDFLYKDPDLYNGHGKIYSLPDSSGIQVRNNAPAALVAKCCRPNAVCTTEDYRGYCP